MLTPALAEQRRPHAFREREARAARRKKKTLTRPSWQTQAGAAPTQAGQRAPAFLPDAGAAELVMEPLYVTASPPGLSTASPSSTAAPMSDSTIFGPGFDAGLYAQLDAAYAPMSAIFGDLYLPTVIAPQPGSLEPVAGGPPPTASPPSAATASESQKPKLPGEGEKQQDEAREDEEGRGGNSSGAPEDVSGPGKAAGAKPDRKGRSGNTPTDRFESDWMPPTPLVAASAPVSIPRTSLNLEVESVAFEAPRKLPFAPVPAKEKSEPSTQSMSDYRAIFADMAADGYGLFIVLREGARRLADETRAFDARLTDAHMSTITVNVSKLDQDLDRARADLMAGRDTLLDSLDRRTRQLRGWISGTASAQVDRLKEREKAYIDGRKGPQAIREATTSYAKGKAAALTKSMDGGEKSLNALKEKPTLLEVSDESGWNPSTNEALQKFLPKIVDMSLKQFAQRRVDYAPLNKLANCIDCQFDRMFQGVDLTAERVGKTGVTKVGEARDSGLSSLNQGAAQLRRAVIESAAATDDALVKQHDQIRVRMIETTKGTLVEERDRTRATAVRQIDMLVSLALAQPGSVQGVVDRLSKSPIIIRAEFRLDGRPVEPATQGDVRADRVAPADHPHSGCSHNGRKPSHGRREIQFWPGP